MYQTDIIDLLTMYIPVSGKRMPSTFVRVWQDFQSAHPVYLVVHLLWACALITKCSCLHASGESPVRLTWHIVILHLRVKVWANIKMRAIKAWKIVYNCLN